MKTLKYLYNISAFMRMALCKIPCGDIGRLFKAHFPSAIS